MHILNLLGLFVKREYARSMSHVAMLALFLFLAVASFFSMRRSGVPMTAVVLTAISCAVIGVVLLYER